MSSRPLRLLSYMTPGFPVSLFEKIASTVGAHLALDQTQSGPAPGEDPFRDGIADLGWICSTSFVDLSTRTADPSLRLAGVAWVPNDPEVHEQPVYFGDLVVRNDSPITTFAELAGHSIGCNDEVSLSGHYSLRKAIDDYGSTPEDLPSCDLPVAIAHRLIGRRSSPCCAARQQRRPGNAGRATRCFAHWLCASGRRSLPKRAVAVNPTRLTDAQPAARLKTFGGNDFASMHR